MTLFKKSSTPLSDKLKGAIENISVDVFGYEKTITKTLIKRLEFYSKKIKKPVEGIHLKIYLRNYENKYIVKAFLSDRNKAILTINTKDLVSFFLNESNSYLIDNDKITHSIKDYLYEFAQANKIDNEFISISIYNKDKNIEVQAFNKLHFVKLISLTSLIKHFKK